MLFVLREFLGRVARAVERAVRARIRRGRGRGPIRGRGREGARRALSAVRVPAEQRAAAGRAEQRARVVALLRAAAAARLRGRLGRGEGRREAARDARFALFAPEGQAELAAGRVGGPVGVGRVRRERVRGRGQVEVGEDVVLLGRGHRCAGGRAGERAARAQAGRGGRRGLVFVFLAEEAEEGHGWCRMGFSGQVEVGSGQPVVWVVDGAVEGEEVKGVVGG